MALADILVLGRMNALVEEELPKHFTIHRIGREDVASLDPALGERITAIAGGAHVPVDAELLGKLPNLEIVANFGVGYDSVDLETECFNPCAHSKARSGNWHPKCRGLHVGGDATHAVRARGPPWRRFPEPRRFGCRDGASSRSTKGP